jgi:ribonucleoside-diphosphate reductase alpha chain
VPTKKKDKPAAPTRRRLPDERRGRVQRFSFTDSEGTPVKGYLRANTYDDGSLGEVFITIDRAGSTLSGFADAVALLMSLLLQHGIPLEVIAQKLVAMKFPPSGFTGDSKIPRSSSILDYVSRWLMLTYGPDKKDPLAAVPEEE